MLLAQFLIPSTELTRTAGPIYGNPNSAPSLVQHNFFLWFAVSCWFPLVLSLIPLPGFFPSPWSFKYFHASTVKFAELLICYSVIDALPHKRRVCALSFPRLPFILQLLSYVFNFVRVLCLTNFGFVQCFARVGSLSV